MDTILKSKLEIQLLECFSPFPPPQQVKSVLLLVTIRMGKTKAEEVEVGSGLKVPRVLSWKSSLSINQCGTSPHRPLQGPWSVAGSWEFIVIPGNVPTSPTYRAGWWLWGPPIPQALEGFGSPVPKAGLGGALLFGTGQGHSVGSRASPAKWAQGQWASYFPTWLWWAVQGEPQALR